jgi:hypothetical protein
MGRAFLLFLPSCASLFLAAAGCGGCGELRETPDAGPVAIDGACSCARDAGNGSPMRDGGNVALDGGCPLGDAAATGPESVTVDAPSVAPVDAGGWSWFAPLPQGEPITGIWAAGQNDVWATTINATLHFDGTAWAVATSNGGAAIVGAGPLDVWSVGNDGAESAVEHYDGTAWSAVPGSPGLGTPLWASGPNDLWASILHFDGTSWTQTTLPGVYGADAGSGGYGEDYFSLTSLSGTGPNDLWAAVAILQDEDEVQPAVGDGILHWNGSSWAIATTQMGTATTPLVWANDVADAWAVLGPTTLHWDGCQWSVVPSPWAIADAGAGGSVTALWGSARSDVWAAAFSAPASLGGTPPLSMWHWTGASWTEAATNVFPSASGAALPAYEAASNAVSLTGSGSRDAWAAMGPNLAHWDGTSWTVESPNPLPANVEFAGGWESSPTDGWAFGVTAPFTLQTGLVDPSYVGTPALMHWNGSAWSSVTAPDTFAAMWGAASDDVWAVANDSSVVSSTSYDTNVVFYHWDGSAWTSAQTFSSQTPVPLDLTQGPAIRSLWGSASDDVWAVGTMAWTGLPAADAGANSGYPGALSFHWDGTSWSPVTITGPSSDPNDLGAIWGSAADDVWAVGLRTIVHFDGTAWTPSAFPTGIPPSEWLGAVWGTGPNDVWAGAGPLSDDPILLHWDGSSWSDSGMSQGASFWGAAGGPLWATDDAGAVWLWDGQAWSLACDLAGLTYGSIATSYGAEPGLLWGSGTDAWMAGNGVLLHHP